MNDVAILIEQLIGLLTQHAWIPATSIIVGLLIRLSKNDRLVAKIPFYIAPKYRSWAAVGLGILGGILECLATGGNLARALTGGFIAGIGAISTHELVVESARKGRDLGIKKTPGGGALDDEPVGDPLDPTYGDSLRPSVRPGPARSSKIKMAALVLAVSVATLPGCAAFRNQDVKNVVRAIAEEIIGDAVSAGPIIEAMHSVATMFFLASPDAPSQAKVEQVFADIHIALDVAIRLGQGANIATTADYNAAFAEFRKAYQDATKLLQELGIVGAPLGATGKMSAKRGVGSAGTFTLTTPRAALARPL